MSHISENALSQKDSFSKELFQSIQGFAVIIMVYHHCFGFPGWYIESIAHNIHYSELELHIARVSKLCVSIFAFLTGWAYYLHKQNAVRYSIKKIASLLFRFSVIVLVLLLAVHAICGAPVTVTTFLNQLFPIKGPFFPFSWYIIFYIIAMLLLPYITKLEYIKNKIWLLTFLVIAYICTKHLLHNTPICYVSIYMPCIIVGYWCAQFRIFEKYVSKIQNIKGAKIIGLILVLAPYVILYKISMLRPLSAFLICAGIMLLFPLLKRCKAANILCHLGKHSLNIWILHNIYFARTTKAIFQPFAYAYSSPIYVLFVVIGSCYIVSSILVPIQNYVERFFMGRLKDL